jgi:MFS family permease
MAGGGLLFGLAPTGSIMGVVLLVVSRVIQGMATGGEFAAYVSYLAEVVPERVRGKYSSSAYVTSTLGVTLATVFLLELGWHLSPAGQDRWGWRVPFIFASTVAIIGFYLRVTLIEESKYFEADRAPRFPG